MISFAVGDGGGGVGMGRQVVEFRDSIMDALWHGVLLARWIPFFEQRPVRRFCKPTSKTNGTSKLIDDGRDVGEVPRFRPRSNQHGESGLRPRDGTVQGIALHGIGPG